MVSGPALLIAIAAALSIYVGGEVAHGVKALGCKMHIGHCLQAAPAPAVTPTEPPQDAEPVDTARERAA